MGQNQQNLLEIEKDSEWRLKDGQAYVKLLRRLLCYIDKLGLGGQIKWLVCLGYPGQLLIDISTGSKWENFAKNGRAVLIEEVT